MRLGLARTNAEAHIYMELNPCGDCGESRFAPVSAVIEIDGDLASQYAGPCPRCGTPREFVFRLPQEVILPDHDNLPFGDEHHSELLDAGQWLWLADVLATNTPAEPTSDMTTQQRRQARRDLLTAAAAVDEVIKFLPDETDTVPPESLWSQQGRTVYEREPGRFHRRRLNVIRRTYRDLAQQFPD